MTESETAALLAIAAKAYPGRMLVDREMVPLWHSMLLDVDATEAIGAMRTHCATSVHPPCIADIRTRVAQVREPGIDIAAAWEEIRKAILRCGYNREPGTLDQRTGEMRPGWSSPRIAAVVEAIGWQTICWTNVDDVPTLRAQVERYLKAGIETAQRKANTGALEAAQGESAALVASVTKKLTTGQP